MLLLMGGKSTRMGTSKAKLLYNGVPFWKKISEEMSSCGPLYLSVARTPVVSEMASETERFGSVPMSAAEDELAGYRLVQDEIDGIGPMGGIYSAMRQIREESFFVCACDMPLMSRQYIETLLEIWRGLPAEEEWDGLMVRDKEGRIYTVAGIYHKRMLSDLEARIHEGNYRMMALLRNRRIYYVEEERIASFSEALTNVNTMEDYKGL